MRAYLDSDPRICAWLAGLVKYGLLPAGCVVREDIRRPAVDYAAFDVVHFFAGIGGWELALQYSGVLEELPRPVWTGSCPCQPFSGLNKKRKGEEDARHLWPYWRNRIAEHRPAVVFGEQVASPDGRAWLATVLSDLEELGYIAAAADLCAACVGAPQRRQRLWFGAVDHTVRQGLRMRNAERQRACCQDAPVGMPSLGDCWREVEWIYCEPNVWRPIEPGLEPLAYGISAGLVRCRGYGNAIVPQVGAVFIRAFWEAVCDLTLQCS